MAVLASAPSSSELDLGPCARPPGRGRSPRGSPAPPWRSAVSVRRSRSRPGGQVGHQVEVGRVDEATPRGRGSAALLSRSCTARPDVAHVEVDGVAVEQQHQRRQAEQHGQAQGVARGLAQLLARDGPDLARGSCAAVAGPGRLFGLDAVDEDVLERGHDALDRERAEARRARAPPGSGRVPASASATTTWSRVPKTEASSTQSSGSRRSWASSTRGQETSRSARPANTSFSSADRAQRDQPAGVHQRDPVAALGLVEVVGGDDDGHALPGHARRSGSRSGGARSGRRRRWARRGRAPAARGARRRPAPGAASSRPGSDRVSRSSLPSRPAMRTAQPSRSSRARPRRP